MVEMGVLTDQGKAVGDRGQLISAFDAGGTETVVKQPPHGGDERGAAGQEDMVDFVSIQSGQREDPVNRGVDGSEVWRDPALELGAADLGLDAEVGAGKAGRRRNRGDNPVHAQ